MKKLVILGLVYILLLPLLVLGCQTVDTRVPTTGGGESSQTIEITLDEFMAQNNIVKSVEIGYPGSLTIKLGTNPTTGYDWGEAVVSDPAVIVQTSYEYAGPTDTAIVGAGGTDVLEFDALKTGTATIKMGYSRPWEGGEKDTFTLTVNVTVK